MKRVWAGMLAVVMAALLLAGCSSKPTEYAILDEALADEEYGIGFRKGDFALQYEVEKILVELKNDGTLAEISKKWFDEDKITVPDTYTPPTQATDDSLQKVKDKGALTLGLDDSLPPMGFRSSDGEVVGFDIDVAQKVCEKMGVTLYTQSIDWNAKEQELSSGKIDCIWNGFTINEERKQNMNLTFPYMTNRQVVVVLKDSEIKSLADLSGKKVVLQQSSTAEQALDKNEELKNSLKEVVKVKNNVIALNDLGRSGCDAVVMDETVARYYKSRTDQLALDASAAGEQE